MKKPKCQGCGGEFPMNEMGTVFGQALCEPCARKGLEAMAGKALPAAAVQPLVDPTVCARCGADGGEAEWRMVAKMPLCDRCHGEVTRFAFPAWVKFAVLGIVVLGVVEAVRNVRFFQAYFEAPAAMNAYAKGDLATASRLMDQAAGHVPESAFFANEVRHFHALTAAQEGKVTEAIKALEQCLSARASFGAPADDIECQLATLRIIDHLQRDEYAEAESAAREFASRFGTSEQIEDLLETAVIGRAFDAGDYTKMAEAARKRAERMEGSLEALMVLAGALAAR